MSQNWRQAVKKNKSRPIQEEPAGMEEPFIGVDQIKSYGLFSQTCHLAVLRIDRAVVVVITPAGGTVVGKIAAVAGGLDGGVLRRCTADLTCIAASEHEARSHNGTEQERPQSPGDGYVDHGTYWMRLWCDEQWNLRVQRCQRVRVDPAMRHYEETRPSHCDGGRNGAD